MTRLLLAVSVLFLATFSAYSQNWQVVGNPTVPVYSGTPVEVDFVLDENDVPYVFYVESDYGSVKKWDGTNWVLVGTADFTELAPFDIKLEVVQDTVYVSYYWYSAGSDFIKVHKFNGTTWEDLSSYIGQGVIVTNHARPYDFNVSPSGVVQLAFYENFWTNQWIFAIHNGSYFHDPYNYFPTGAHEDLKIETDEFGNDWFLLSDVGQTELYKRNVTAWNLEHTYFSGGPNHLKNDLDVSTNTGGDDVHVTALLSRGGADNISISQYDAGTLNYNSDMDFTDDLELFDIAADDLGAYVFGTKQTGPSTREIWYYDFSGATTTSVLHPFTGNLLGAEIELKSNGEPVVAFIENGDIWVYESWQTVGFTINSNLEVCSGITEIIPSAVTVQSENLDNSELIFNVTHALGTITSAGLNLATFPNYDLTISSQKVYTNESITLDVDLFRSGGVLENSDQEDILVKAVDSIYNTYQGFAICENNGVIDFRNYLMPAGGSFTGDISSNGILNPSIAPNPATFYYSTISSEGCFNQHPVGFNINPAPIATIVDSDAGCNDSTGTATVTASGGTAPYDYYWTTGADSTNLTGLPAGQYFVTVTDNNGCMATGVANIGNSSINLLGNASTLNCPGDNNGQIDLTIAGVGPYDILWSNGYSTEDITGLTAGTYDVTVEDANGCVATETFEVMAPNEIMASASIVNSACGASDGTITLTVTGGDGTYTYAWRDEDNNSIGSNSPNLTGAFGGLYTCDITDGNGCAYQWTGVVNDNGAPVVTINSITNAGCTNDGAINMSFTTTAPLNYIEWSNGASTEDISNLAAGTYAVWVVDQNGCTGMGEATVYPASPATPEICAVTVDSATTRNLVVWEKPVTTEISHYNIYREGSQAGVYVKIDSVLYTEDSEFVDPIASPMVRSWRYKISAVNNCGIESSRSDYHKTIHATINLGLGGNINLLWDAYEGLTYTSISCWRNTDVNGFELLWTNPSTQFSFTDTPPSTINLDYVLGFPLASTCSSSLLKAQDYNGTRSNRSAGIFNGSGLGLDDVNTTDFDVSIYPNPAKESTNVHITGSANGLFDVEIIDARGRVVKTISEQQRKFTLDLNQFENGIYYLTITNNNIKKISKLIVNQ